MDRYIVGGDCLSSVFVSLELDIWRLVQLHEHGVEPMSGSGYDTRTTYLECVEQAVLVAALFFMMKEWVVGLLLRGPRILPLYKNQPATDRQNKPL